MTAVGSGRAVPDSEAEWPRRVDGGPSFIVRETAAVADGVDAPRRHCVPRRQCRTATEGGVQGRASTDGSPNQKYLPHQTPSTTTKVDSTMPIIDAYKNAGR